MSDLTDTLHKLEALQALYATKQETSTEPASEDLMATVDIGSTFTRCTYSFRNEDECLDLYVCSFRNSIIDANTNKVPTSVLVNKRGQFVSFGFDAHKDYVEFGKAKGYFLFDQFFAKLHEEQSLTEHTQIVSSDCKGSTSALHILSMILAQLKKHISKEASLKTEGKAHAYACWVLTVPAVWGEPKRRFLRHAALRAGLITDIDSRKLRMLRGEEAVFQYCSGLDSSDFTGKPPPETLSVQPGDRYLMLDAGGSTLRGTAYEYSANGTSRALHSAISCGPVGTHVDSVFANIMENVFSKEFIDILKEESPETWQSIMAACNEKKHTVRSDTPGSVKIYIPSTFQDSFERIKKTTIGEAIKISRINGLKYISPNLWVSTDTIRSSYKRIIEFTITYIRDLLMKLKDMKRIYLVGGFFESDIVQRAMLAAFEDTHVLIPAQPSQVTSMSAALLGLEQDPDE